jgi:hypothetical protein
VDLSGPDPREILIVAHPLTAVAHRQKEKTGLLCVHGQVNSLARLESGMKVKKHLMEKLGGRYPARAEELRNATLAGNVKSCTAIGKIGD